MSVIAIYYISPFWNLYNYIVLLHVSYSVFLYNVDRINVQSEVNLTGTENMIHSHTQLVKSQEFPNSQTVCEPIISEQINIKNNEVQKYEEEKGNIVPEIMISTNISQETPIVNIEENISTAESDKGKISSYYIIMIYVNN